MVVSFSALSPSGRVSWFSLWAIAFPFNDGMWRGSFIGDKITPARIPSGSDGEESACHVGDQSLIPGSERSPGEGNGYPLQYSWLENSMDRGAWWVRLWGQKVSDTTELLSIHIWFCRIYEAWYQVHEFLDFGNKSYGCLMIVLDDVHTGPSKEPVILEQFFLNFQVHADHLGILVKCRF